MALWASNQKLWVFLLKPHCVTKNRPINLVSKLVSWSHFSSSWFHIFAKFVLLVSFFRYTQKKKRPTRAFVKRVSWFPFFSSWFHNFVKLVSWFHFKNETSSRILKHETTKCNLQTAIYYGDFGVLQKTIFFGFIFMKLEFRCTNSFIIFEFCFYIYGTNPRFSAPLHRIPVRCQ